MRKRLPFASRECQALGCPFRLIQAIHPDSQGWPKSPAQSLRPCTGRWFVFLQLWHPQTGAQSWKLTTIGRQQPAATFSPRPDMPRHTQLSCDVDQLSFGRRAAFLSYHQLHLQLSKQSGEFSSGAMEPCCPITSNAAGTLGPQVFQKPLTGKIWEDLGSTPTSSCCSCCFSFCTSASCLVFCASQFQSSPLDMSNSQNLRCRASLDGL